MANLAAVAVNAVVLFPSLLIAYGILKTFYNLFLHPLRSYPGPILARATILASQSQFLQGKEHLYLHELHKKYGPVVRYAPNALSFIHADAWKQVYAHGHSFPKDMTFYGPDVFGSPPGLIRANDVAHARQRKLVSHAFSDKALREQEPLLKNYVELLVKQLKQTISQNPEHKADLVSWYNFTTFDIMADLTFGEPLHLLEESTYTPWVRSIFDNIKLIFISSLIRQWPGFTTLLEALVPKTVLEKKKTHMSHSDERVAKRLARKTDRPDIWTYVLRHSEDEEKKGKGLLPTEMRSNAALFMLAGTETTATELAGLTYRLLKSPEKFDKLVKEIRGAFETYDDFHMGRLAGLEYLHACLEEGLRLYPPVPVGLRRKVSKGGAVVGEKLVPEGVSVQIPMFSAYHSKLNFKDPENFIPERWLPEGQEEYGEDNKGVLQPFSHGPRNCLGKNLAYHEMRLVLATMLWHFDMELCEESDGWENQQCFVLWKKGPLMVKLTPIRN